ncbi:MAG: regulator of (H+)-ATPase in vacuolar membrane [Alyxoria varia]|nr:MAG: regulator of (H+)-ATPase in vacuolar membrane [Alyxoria varia]
MFWNLQNTFTPFDNDTSLASLSWGLPGEVLIGGSALSLLSTDDGLKEQWTSKPLARPVKFAKFSHDACLIASTGWHDRLVKVWRRLFLGEGNERFDTAYLRHPTTVTNIRWRGRPRGEQHLDAILYTTCADNHLRMWTASDHHCLQILNLWEDLDLVPCIQPPTPLSPSPFKRRCVTIIDALEFKAMVGTLCENETPNEREQHTRDRLQDIASEDPDICMVFDDAGNMSAWALEHVGAKVRPEKDVLNIGHAYDLKLVMASDKALGSDYVQCMNVANSSGALEILVNFFDGRLHWLSGDLATIFDPSPASHCLDLDSSLTGHTGVVELLTSNSNGNVMLSYSSNYEAICWLHEQHGSTAALNRRSIADLSEPVIDMQLLWRGQYVLFLHKSKVSVWNVHNSRASQVAQTLLNAQKIVHGLITLRSPKSDQDAIVVGVLGSGGSVQLIELSFPSKDSVSMRTCSSKQLFCGVNSTMTETIVPLPISAFLNKFQRGNALSFSQSGALKLLTIDHARDIDRSFTLNESSQTGLTELSIVRPGPSGLVALVDKTRTRFTIWNMHLDCYDHTQHYQSHETINDLRWSLLPNKHGVLAVAFNHKVRVYVQQRYDYSTNRSPWTLSTTIDVAENTNLPISDIEWAIHGNIVVAAGTQIFMFETIIDKESDLRKLYNSTNRSTDAPGASLETQQIEQMLNSHLPIYHPQFVSATIHSRKVEVAIRVLDLLSETLKFYAPGDEILSFLGKNPDFLSVEQSAAQEESETSTKDSNLRLVEQLNGTEVPLLTQTEQAHLKSTVLALGLVEKQRESIDDCGLRFLAIFHEYHANLEVGLHERSQIPWRDVNWAVLSESQEILTDATSRRYHGRMLWRDAKETGMFMWLKDVDALKSQFEIIARNEYTKTDERNPIDCSLHYLALGKKSVLQGLWRMATWNRERGATMRILENDFKDPRWRTAAQKNAYTLLGKRRVEYAASFFLLADRLKDAVGVLANQLGDIQLAIAVARVSEGNDGPVLRDLLETTVLPQAVREGSKWLASWAFSMLGRWEMAVKALLYPPHELVKQTEPPPAEARSYLNEDPSLISMYTHIRDKAFRNPREAPRLSPNEEWDFVMRSVRLYCRMGCDTLALDLGKPPLPVLSMCVDALQLTEPIKVRNWKFSTQGSQYAQTTANGVDATAGVTKALGATSLEEGVDNDAVPSDDASEASKKDETGKKVVEEPSASSILDTFDF